MLNLNRFIKQKQFKVLWLVGGVLFLITASLIAMLADGKPKKTTQAKEINLTGIVDESFTEAHANHALTEQQAELESLKEQMKKLKENIKAERVKQQKELTEQADIFKGQITNLEARLEEKQAQGDSQQQVGLPQSNNGPNQGLWHQNTVAMNGALPPGLMSGMSANSQPQIHVVSFRKRRVAPRINSAITHLNPNHYVPSNTSVRAVVLGGADADASVNGQSKNNGVMLFKFLEDGTLPNGQHSRLRGCRVSANSYGDISSERAFATLYHLSCAHSGEPIIDKEVTGWVFFNGKVGIKGQPLMRDNKVMTWAGVSGALSGIAEAAQYAQSIQNIGPYGASSVVPSGQIGPFAAYGGASKAADTLSQYYVKRAEQYHPVIQVGAGNVVTVVFKDGFYLEPEEDREQHAANQSRNTNSFQSSNSNSEPESENETEQMNFTVPPEVLSRIEHQGMAGATVAGGNP